MKWWSGALLLLMGCGGASRPTTPPPPYQAAGTLELPGSKNLKLYLDTEKKLFRAESRDYIYLGTLETGSEVVVIHPETKKLFRYYPRREDEIEKQFGRAARARYQEVATASLAEHYQRNVMLPFESPCGLGDLKQHPSCSHWTDKETGLEVWQHYRSRYHFDRNNGIEHDKSYSRHYVDPELGITFGADYATSQDGPWDTPYRPVQKTAVEQSLFQVPEGMTELFLESEMKKDEEPPLVAWPEIIEGRAFQGPKTAARSDFPAPPATRSWHIASEDWGAPDRTGFSVVVATPDYPSSPAAGPPVYEDTRWLFGADRWDQETLVGERSRKPESDRIVFTQNGRLYSVRMYPDQLAEKELLPLARRIAEKEKSKPSLANGAPFQRLGRFLRRGDQKLSFESGHTLHDKEEAEEDPGGWCWYNETWTGPRFRVTITTGWHPQPGKLNQLPLPGPYPKSEPIEAWDEFTAVGERCRIEDTNDTVIFLRKGLLVRVYGAGIFPDEVLKMAKQIDEKLTNEENRS